MAGRLHFSRGLGLWQRRIRPRARSVWIWNALPWLSESIWGLCELFESKRLSPPARRQDHHPDAALVLETEKGIARDEYMVLGRQWV